ncbi:ABC transporter permease [Falsiroseomonas bella]|uniref:ABC transporter permease n=1 Tax=Falsiroseomonas bella TaxID=2184016 RepID=A0A317FLB8_9PROT|nr:ABC transporter permease [Falsiroseomonas bella]PWS38376.1 ABC transporter permease [Falsiroseomonas bella]
MRSPTLPLASPRYVRDAADPRHVERAIDDMRGGLARWRLAMALARLDIRNRYRGSVIGPFWLTVSTAVMVAGIGLLYSTLFRLPLTEYLPYLTVSLLVWNTLNQIINDAGNSLIASEGVIRQVPLPYTVHVLRFVIRNVIVAAHSLPLIAVVFLICGVVPGWGALMALPGLALLFINAFAGGLFLGMICARFRDIQQIVASVMQLAFFMTPVIWKPELLREWQVLLPLNPFFALMETVRGPLVEGGASWLIWLAALVYTAAACAVAFVFFVRFRARIAFWV